MVAEGAAALVVEDVTNKVAPLKFGNSQVFEGIMDFIHGGFESICDTKDWRPTGFTGFEKC